MLKKIKILQRIFIVCFSLYFIFSAIPLMLDSESDLLVILGVITIISIGIFGYIYRYSIKRWFKNIN